MVICHLVGAVGSHVSEKSVLDKFTGPCWPYRGPSLGGSHGPFPVLYACVCRPSLLARFVVGAGTSQIMGSAAEQLRSCLCLPQGVQHPACLRPSGPLKHPACCPETPSAFPFLLGFAGQLQMASVAALAVEEQGRQPTQAELRAKMAVLQKVGGPL